MTRIALDQRLDWIKTGHIGHQEYVYKRMCTVASMTMNQYFGGNQREVKGLADHLQMQVSDVKDMTYSEVVQCISRMNCDNSSKKDATDALWDLAGPYLREGRRRARKNGSYQLGEEA